MKPVLARSFLALSLAAALTACSDDARSPSAETGDRPARADRATVTLPDFAELVETHGQAVVNIRTVTRVEGRGRHGIPPGAIPEMFRRFFDFDVPGMEEGEQESQSQGSGFILSSDGDILTNYHVVRDATRVLVRLQDRRELEATVVGSDPQSDLALLRIEASDLPVVKVGSSNDLRVGEWVLAIGAPFGFESSVTAGIVSALGRSLPNENYVPFIQTDVAINPGNSGGPLFNLDGEVVGINSQILSQSGGYMGLSFAIPIDMAMDVVRQLKDTGKVARGWLGILIQDVDRDLAESFGLDKPAGALVAQVVEDSPAAESGLQAGDVIIEANGTPIDRSAQLPHQVGRLAPGTKVKLVLIRNGDRKTLTVTVGAMPEEGQGSGRTVTKESVRSRPLGLAVAPLTAEEQRRLKTDQGVRITDVGEGPARRAGLRAGDVLQRLNNRAVDSAERLAEIVGDLPQDSWVPVLVVRDGAPRFMALRIESGDE